MQVVNVKNNDVHQDIEIMRSNSDKDYLECIRNIIRSKPFGNHKFYIFSFLKRVDDLVGIKKMYHQPRLTKPDPAPQTSLIKVDPCNPDWCDIKWTIPHEQTFKMFGHGKAFANEFTHDCIVKFLKRPHELSRPDDDDLNEDQIRQVYSQIFQEKARKKAEG